MIESQAQRTLVKSPPELWAEVSDPAALARHLGEIAAEIRITAMESERSVAWEGDRASGRVELAPSGWGTKVILTLSAAGADPTGGGASAADVHRQPAPHTEEQSRHTGEPAVSGGDDPAGGQQARAPSEPALVAADEAPLAVEDLSSRAPGRDGAARVARRSPGPEQGHGQLAPDEPPAAVASDGAGTAPVQQAEAAPTRQEAPGRPTGAAPRPSEPTGGFLARLRRRFSRRAQPPPEAEQALPDQPSPAPLAARVAPPAGVEATGDGIGRPRADGVERVPRHDPPAPTPPRASPHTASPRGTPRSTSAADRHAPDPLGAFSPSPEIPPHANQPAGEVAPAPMSTMPAAPSRELSATEPIDEARANAALSAMLDSLGTAHHRPYSRA